MLRDITAVPIHDTVKEGATTQVLFTVEVDETEDAEPTSKTRLMVAVDRSGSMGEVVSGEVTKMDRAKESLAWVIDNLSSDDELCVVSFDDKIEVTIPLQPVGNNAEVLKAQISSGLSPRGMTNIGDAVLECYRQMTNNDAEDVVTKIIVLSDGQANEGVTRPESIRGLIQNARSNSDTPTTISAFGLGEGYDEMFMGSIAESGSGGRYHIQNPDHIPEMLSRDLSVAKNTVARNAILEVRTSNATLITTEARNVGGEGEWRDGQLSINLGDLVAGEIKDVLVEFDLAPRDAKDFEDPAEFGEMAGVQLFDDLTSLTSDRHSLCDYQLIWTPVDDVVAQETIRESVTVALGDENAMEASVHEEAQSRAIILMLSSAFCEASDLIDSGKSDEAAELLRPIIEDIGDDPPEDYWKDYPDIFQVIYDAAKDLLERIESGRVGSNMAQTYFTGTVSARGGDAILGSQGDGTFNVRALRTVAYNATRGGVGSSQYIAAASDIEDPEWCTVNLTPSHSCSSDEDDDE